MNRREMFELAFHTFDLRKDDDANYIADDTQLAWVACNTALDSLDTDPQEAMRQMGKDSDQYAAPYVCKKLYDAGWRKVT